MSYNKKLLQQITERLNKPSKPKVPRNQWQHPGEVTSIPSRFITMKGVSYPVLGVGADGTAELMQPGMDYAFPQGPVVEYPMMQYGGQNIPRIQLNRATSESTAIPRGMDPRYQAALTNDMKRVEFEKARSKQPFLGSGRPINAEETKRRNKIYAKNQGLGYNEVTGRVYDPVSPQASKTMSAAYENIVEPAMTVMLDMEGLGALGTTKPLVNAGVFNKLGDRTNMFIQRTLRNLKPGYVARKKELIDRGNQWTRDWFNHPISQQRYNDWVENPFLDMNTDEALRTLYNPDGVVTSDIPLLQGTVARNNMANFMESGVATVGTKNRKDFESSNVLGRYHHGRNDALVDVLHPDLRHTANTAVHENIHYLTKGTDGLTKNARKFLQKPFDIDPATNLPVKSNLETSGVNVVYDKYLTEPTEVHARIAELRRSFGLKPDQEVDIKTLNRIIEQGLQGNTSVDRRFFELVNNKRALKWLFNNAPAVAAPVAGVTMMQEKANGGMIFDKGGSYKGYSVVDYLNSVGLDSSKAARKQLAQELGIQNYDYSAGKNLELLDALQNGTDAPAPKTLAKGVVDLMIPRAYFDPRVGQPNMKLQQISSTGGRPTTLAPGVVDIIVPKYRTAPKVGNKKMSLRSISTTGGRPAPVVEEPNEFIEGVSELYNDSVDYLSGLASGIKRKYEQMQDEDVSSIVKKPVAPVDPTKYGYQQLYAVPDVGGARGDSLVAFTNTFDNSQGGRYYIGNKVKEVTDAGAKRRFENTHGVGHFLRDSDILPNQKITPESWNTVKGYTFHTTSPGKTVSAGHFDDPNWYRMLYRRDPNDQDPNAYSVRYMRNEDVNKTQDQLKKEGWNLDYTVSGQHRFSDLDWDGEGPGTGYASKSKWVPLKNSNKYAYIPYKNKDGFSRFSGGSGVYIFKDPKTNKEIGVDVAGSVNTLRQVGEDLVKTHGIKPEDLTFVYHDMGSYSAKPKSRDGVLDYSQWINYNNYNKGFSGAPLMIRRKNGGQHGGLDRWFAEKWVDVKTGEECGRQEGDDRNYPACRPSKRINDDTPKTASELSSAERQKFIRSKTSSERINYQHRRKEYGGELDSDLPPYQLRGQVTFQRPRAVADNTRTAPVSNTSFSKNRYDTRRTITDGSMQEGRNDMTNWMKYWLTQRSQNPDFSQWANNRLNVLKDTSKKYNIYTNDDIEKGSAPFNSQAFYRPVDSTLWFNKDYPSSSTASVQIHEMSHKMDTEDNTFYKQLLKLDNDIDLPFYYIKNKVVPNNENFAKEKYTGTKDEYTYLSNPTEINARLNELRYFYNLDPKKRYTAKDMEKIINDHNEYRKTMYHPLNLDQLKSLENSGHGISELLKIIGNDPQKLADLQNSIVMNNTPSSGNLSMAATGGQTRNKPNNPSLWSKAKAMAKEKYDVYPSAYANGWAAKWYKSNGGTWSKAAYGMQVPPMMQQGGEPDGSMALGQIDAAIDKLMTLRKFIQPDSDLEPWVSSKLTLMDHYTDAVSDYMQYNPEAQGMMPEEQEQMMMEEGGGIPERYKNMGFSRVGQKKESTSEGKKWMVLAKKGDDYKVVHGGYDGMQDYTQHGSEQRRENFWNRMGGRDSAKANDPFSPLYWHKRFGTWEEGGEIPQMKKGGSTWAGNTWFGYGGDFLPEYQTIGTVVEGDTMPQYITVDPTKISTRYRNLLETQEAPAPRRRSSVVVVAPPNAPVDPVAPPVINLDSIPNRTGIAIDALDSTDNAQDSAFANMITPAFKTQDSLAAIQDSARNTNNPGFQGNPAFDPNPKHWTDYLLPTAVSGYIGVKGLQELNKLSGPKLNPDNLNDFKTIIQKRGVRNADDYDKLRKLGMSHSEAQSFLKGMRFSDTPAPKPVTPAPKAVPFHSVTKAFDADTWKNFGFDDVNKANDWVNGLTEFEKKALIGAKSISKDELKNTLQGLLDAQKQEDARIRAEIEAKNQAKAQRAQNRPASGKKGLTPEQIEYNRKLDSFNKTIAEYNADIQSVTEDLKERQERLARQRPGSKAYQENADAIEELRRIQKVNRRNLNLSTKKFEAHKAAGLPAASATPPPAPAPAPAPGTSRVTPPPATPNVVNNAPSPSMLEAFQNSSAGKALRSGIRMVEESAALRNLGKLLRIKEQGGELPGYQVGSTVQYATSSPIAGVANMEIPSFVQFLDPTGVTNWPDSYRTFTDPNSDGWDKLGAALNVVPMIGKAGKVMKAADFARKSSLLGKAGRYGKIALNALDNTMSYPARAMDKISPVQKAYQAGTAKMTTNWGPRAQTAAQIANAVNQGNRGLQGYGMMWDNLKDLSGYNSTTPKKKAGGGIHIDPSKKGTFKAQASRMGMSVQEAASKILSAPVGKYSPEMRKKANFAKNFAKEYGGPVAGEEMDVTPEQLEMLRQQGYEFEIL